MATVTGYMNIYRSGYYHRKGKPNAYDRHAGDIYPDVAAALADIHPKSHFIATVPVTWHEDVKPQANASDSEPVRLGLTRKEA